MFTGIVETMGTVVSSRPVAGGRTLSIDAGAVADGAIQGASIAVNGVCLTVTGARSSCLDFDVIAETLRRSNLGHLKAGDVVNLERSLRANERLEGHFVQGHIDGTAEVTRRLDSPREWALWLRPGPEVRPYLIPKGSVAIDGVSLTIAAVEKDRFSVALIPTTLKMTTLGLRRAGDTVNIESDILVRTVIHHLERLDAGSGLSPDMLREHGYL
jgi:riboflavin synthase